MDNPFFLHCHLRSIHKGLDTAEIQRWITSIGSALERGLLICACRYDPSDCEGRTAVDNKTEAILKWLSYTFNKGRLGITLTQQEFDDDPDSRDKVYDITNGQGSQVMLFALVPALTLTE